MEIYIGYVPYFQISAQFFFFFFSLGRAFVKDWRQIWTSDRRRTPVCKEFDSKTTTKTIEEILTAFLKIIFRSTAINCDIVSCIYWDIYSWPATADSQNTDHFKFRSARLRSRLIKTCRELYCNNICFLCCGVVTTGHQMGVLWLYNVSSEKCEMSCQWFKKTNKY